MKMRVVFIALFLLFTLSNTFCKIGDPDPILFNDIIYQSHLNIVYAFDASILTNEEVQSILKREKIISNVNDGELDDYFIYLNFIWKTEVYKYYPPLIPLDQYFNIIINIEIENGQLKVTNKKNKIFYLDLLTGKKSSN